MISDFHRSQANKPSYVAQDQASKPTSDPAIFMNKPRDTAQNDPVRAILLVCVALGCSLLAFVILLRRFCMNRQIQRFVASYAVGKFLVELRAESDDTSLNPGSSDFSHVARNYDAERNVQRSTATQRYPMGRVYDGLRDFFSERLNLEYFDNDGPSVTETDAITTTLNDADSVFICECDDDTEGSYSPTTIPRSNVFRVLDGNIFNTSYSQPVDVERQQFL